MNWSVGQSKGDNVFDVQNHCIQCYLYSAKSAEKLLLTPSASPPRNSNIINKFSLCALRLRASNYSDVGVIKHTLYYLTRENAAWDQVYLNTLY